MLIFGQKKRSHGLLIGVIITVTVIAMAFIIIFVIKSVNQRKNASDVMDDARSFLENDLIGHEGDIVNVDSAPNLNEIIPTWDLRVLKYHYNSICTVRENHHRVYYINYEGTVDLGIDSREISFDEDDENRIITIKLPDVQIIQSYVDTASLRFIFIDDSYDTPENGAEALSLCQEDLIRKTGDDQNMLNMARTSCRQVVEAMLVPFVELYYPDYTYIIEFRGLSEVD